MMAKIATVFKGLEVELTDPAKQFIFEQAINNASSGNTLVIKMEVRRLLRDCSRVIDLRGKVDGECDVFELDGINHCMDDIAKEVFDQQIKIYGFYSVGVYEAVHKTENNFRMRYEREIHQAQQLKNPHNTSNEGQSAERPQINYTVPSFTLSDIDRRQQARMSFSCPVDLMNHEHLFIEANAMDLSLNGIRVKTENAEPIEVGQKLALYFTGLATQYGLDDIDGEPYEVVNISHNGSARYIGLKRTKAVEHDTVSNFLREVTHSLAPVDKVDVSNELRALQVKTFEQHYCAVTTTFPIFLFHKDGRYIPRYTLYNDVNEKSLYYWSNAQGDINFEGLLSDTRLKLMIDNLRQNYLVYAFTQVINGEIHYFSATEEELSHDPQLRNAFLAFASDQGSWRVFQVAAHPVDANRALRSLTNSDGDDPNEGVNEKVQRILPNIKCAVLVTDLTNKIATLEYQRYQVDKRYFKKFQKLRKMGTPEFAVRACHLTDLESLQIMVRSPVPVRTKTLVEVAGVSIEGVSQDLLSVSLSVAFKAAFPGEKGQVCHLAFPDLQASSKKHRLSNLAYEVTDIDAGGKVVAFSVHRERGGALHPMENFVTVYSRDIAQKIYAARKKVLVPELGNGLRRIFAAITSSYCLYIKRTGNYRLPLYVTRPNADQSLKSLFNFGVEEGQGEYPQNSYPLFSSAPYETHPIIEQLRLFPAKSLPDLRHGMRRELFMAFFDNETSLTKAFISRFSDEFDGIEARRAFIEKTRARGQFFALHVIVTQSAQVTWQNMRFERQYLRKNAAELLTQFENDVQRVVGCIEVINMTQVTLDRYGL